MKNTVVFFLTDHGISQARGKQFLYEEGILIPFVAWGQGLFPEGKVREDFIAHIDLGATSLQLAGSAVPKWMQGRPLFGDCVKPREFVVSARDRCDETVDRIRSVRKRNFKYIRNYYPKRPYLQPNRYKDGKPFMPTLRKLYEDGKLNAAQLLQLAVVRPEEELYDLSQDPWEIHNLAGNPEYKEPLAELRGILANWVLDSNDQGRFPEADSMYDSDMDLNLNKGRVRSPERTEVLKVNIALMKQWQAEGK